MDFKLTCKLIALYIGGGEMGSMYVLSYKVSRYVHMYINSMVHARYTYLGLFRGISMNVVCAGKLG